MTPSDAPSGPPSSKPPLRCSEIMKQPVETLREHETVRTAARRMRETDLGFLPVCDDHGVVVGILTDRDIVTRVVAAGEGASSSPVSRVMTRAVVTSGPHDSVSRAAKLMRQHRVTRVLIIDAAGAPLGVISLSDLAQYERPSKTGRTLQLVAERKYAPERP